MSKASREWKDIQRAVNKNWQKQNKPCLITYRKFGLKKYRQISRENNKIERIDNKERKDFKSKFEQQGGFSIFYTKFNDIYIPDNYFKHKP